MSAFFPLIRRTIIQWNLYLGIVFLLRPRGTSYTGDLRENTLPILKEIWFSNTLEMGAHPIQSLSAMLSVSLPQQALVLLKNGKLGHTWPVPSKSAVPWYQGVSTGHTGPRHTVQGQGMCRAPQVKWVFLVVMWEALSSVQFQPVRMILLSWNQQWSTKDM